MNFEFQLQPFNENKKFFVNCDLKHLDHTIEITFHVRGDLENLYVPSLTKAPRRLDDLWKTTCFETFVKPKTAQNYYEVNASPSGDWNLYQFSDYHKDMAEAGAVKTFKIETIHEKKSLQCKYGIDLKQISMPNKNLDLGLSCILETKSGELSYWAVNHKREKDKPDFHLAANFIHI